MLYQRNSHHVSILENLKMCSSRWGYPEAVMSNPTMEGEGEGGRGEKDDD